MKLSIIILAMLISQHSGAQMTILTETQSLSLDNQKINLKPGAGDGAMALVDKSGEYYFVALSTGSDPKSNQTALEIEVDSVRRVTIQPENSLAGETFKRDISKFYVTINDGVCIRTIGSIQPFEIYRFVMKIEK